MMFLDKPRNGSYRVRRAGEVRELGTMDKAEALSILQTEFIRDGLLAYTPIPASLNNHPEITNTLASATWNAETKQWTRDP